MGADGHIIIYDLDLIKKELTNEEIEPLINSVVYIQTMEGREYLTEYWGDNLCYDGSSYAENMAGHEKYDWFIAADEWNRRWDIIRKHKLTQWEVWT
jgi:hypothetical protein